MKKDCIKKTANEFSADDLAELKKLNDWADKLELVVYNPIKAAKN